MEFNSLWFPSLVPQSLGTAGKVKKSQVPSAIFSDFLFHPFEKNIHYLTKYWIPLLHTYYWVRLCWPIHFPLPIRQILLYSSFLHVLLAMFNYGYSIWAVDNLFLSSVRTALGDSFSSELESLHQENIVLIQVPYSFIIHVLIHYSGVYSGTLSLFGCLFRNSFIIRVFIQVLLHYSGAYLGTSTLSLFGCLFRYPFIIRVLIQALFHYSGVYLGTPSFFGCLFRSSFIIWVFIQALFHYSGLVTYAFN